MLYIYATAKPSSINFVQTSLQVHMCAPDCD